MPPRRTARASAAPARIRPRTHAPVALALVLVLLSALVAGPASAAVSGGRSVPSGSASPGQPTTPHTPPKAPRSGEGRSGERPARPSGPTGGAAPGARRAPSPPKKDEPPKRDEPKKDDGPKKDEPKDEGDREPRDDGSAGPNNSDIPSEYMRHYRSAGAAAGVSWRLLATVGKLESDHGRSTLPGVRSGVNGANCCSGPMQMCTVRSCGNTWQAYARDGDGDGRKSVYAPGDAISAAAALLRDLERMFGNHPAHILAGYNAGPGNVQRHRGVPPFPETQGYVRRGLAYMGGLR